jgi:uracil-DNA glycosylase family 4
MTLDELNNRIIACRKCPRLVEWREKIGIEKRKAYKDQEYWAKPVPGFGDKQAQVLIVGLAPGAHGSNRTGRQFTGDSSGDFLYPALFQAGFASQSKSISRDDGLLLKDIYISPVCRCVPPQNKPSSIEIKNCQPYLEEEISILQPRIFVALGRIAYDSLLKIFISNNTFHLSGSNPFSFSHNGILPLDTTYWLVTSYHPSRQNTQTGRLTTQMFADTWKIVKQLMRQVSPGADDMASRGERIMT